jgi:hypothetical protein
VARRTAIDRLHVSRSVMVLEGINDIGRPGVKGEIVTATI